MSISPQLVVKWVLIYAVVLAAAFGLSYYFFTKNESTPPVNEPISETPSWKTYSDSKYNFEIKYPENWHVDVSEANEIPRISFYKEALNPGSDEQVLLSHHVNMTLVTIFPEGLGTEGPFGEARMSTENLTGASEKITQESYLTSNKPRGYYINFTEMPASWGEGGYMWGGVKVENMTTQEIPNPGGIGYPQIKVSGDVSDADMATVKEILSSFKFNQ